MKGNINTESTKRVFEMCKLSLESREKLGERNLVMVTKPHPKYIRS